MALDGIFLHHIKSELQDKLIECRVDKIYQPAKEEIVLGFKGRNGSFKLLLSARANSPRVNITSFAPENPQTPPMLCMLLRKKLSGAKLKDIVQPQLERMLKFVFDATNELGDKVTLNLIIEIMGKHSNVILVDSQNNIIDSLKRVDLSMSQKRLVLPSLKYELPPAQEKDCLLEKNIDDIIKSILSVEKNAPLNKSIISKVQGISPIIAREIEHLTLQGQLLNTKELSDDTITRLKFFLNRISNMTKEVKGTPTMLVEVKTNKPIDYTFTNITQYTTLGKEIKFETFSELLDNFYFERDRVERIKVKAQDLLKLMSNLSDRLIRKINTQKAELIACMDREDMKIYGDLIQANVYRIEKGLKVIEVENFYDEKLPIVKIKLEPSLNGAQNAQKYYTKYRKLKTAEQMLKVQIEKAQEELIYIDTVFDALSRADKESELTQIRQELAQEGYVKARKEKGKREKVKTLPFLEFKSETGFKILVGRNNFQNDKLTLKTAKNYDLWFHTKNIPGSHTVIISDGKEIDENTIILAAQIAAYHSKANKSENVPVDYTIIKNVSKPSGAKPGMVIYKNNKTVYVTPQVETKT